MLLIYGFVFLIIIFALLDRYRQPPYKHTYHEIDFLINDLTSFKNIDEHAYNKTIYHINKFYFYNSEKKHLKMKKHFDKYILYINRISFRLEQDLQRENKLKQIQDDIYLILVQHLHNVYTINNMYFNDIKTTNKLFLI